MRQVKCALPAPAPKWSCNANRPNNKCEKRRDLRFSRAQVSGPDCCDERPHSERWSGPVTLWPSVDGQGVSPDEGFNPMFRGTKVVVELTVSCRGLTARSSQRHRRKKKSSSLLRLCAEASLIVLVIPSCLCVFVFVMWAGGRYLR